MENYPIFVDYIVLSSVSLNGDNVNMSKFKRWQVKRLKSSVYIYIEYFSLCFLTSLSDFFLFLLKINIFRIYFFRSRRITGALLQFNVFPCRIFFSKGKRTASTNIGLFKKRNKNIEFKTQRNVSYPSFLLSLRKNFWKPIISKFKIEK